MSYMAHSAPEPTREDLERRQGTTVVEFGASWCPHCQAAQPLLKQLLDEHSEMDHLKIEDGRGKLLGRAFRVKLWPTFVFLRDGVMQMQVVRPDDAELRRAFQQFTG